jgi:hypothetical protein
MKTKFLITTVLLLSVFNVYSQFKVNADGSVTVSHFKVDSF